MNAIATTAPPVLWKEASTLIHQLFGLFGEPQQIARQQLLGRDAHTLLCKWLRAAEMFVRQLLLIEASAITVPPASSRQMTPAGKMPAVRITHDLDHPESWRVSFRVFPHAMRTTDRRHPAGNRARTRKPSRDETYRYDFIDPENARTWKGLQRGAAVSSPVYGGSVGRAAHDDGGGAATSKPTATPSDRFAITSPVNRGGKQATQFLSAWPLARRAEALLRAYNDPLPFAQRLARKLHAHPERAESIVDACANPHAHHGVLHANLAIELWTCSALTLRVFAPKQNDSS